MSFTEEGRSSGFQTATSEIEVNSKRSKIVCECDQRFALHVCRQMCIGSQALNDKACSCDIFWQIILVHPHSESVTLSPLAYEYSLYYLEAVVISKNCNKRGSRHNHVHSLGVAQLQPRPFFPKMDT